MIYVPQGSVPEADPQAPRCTGCERLMITATCRETGEVAHMCVTTGCPELGCKRCQMLLRWFKAQDAFLTLTIREEDD